MQSSFSFLSLKFNLIVLLTFFSIAAIAQENSDFDIDIEEPEEDYGWKTPAGAYLEPTSFFSLHGYVNSVFGSKSDEWTLTDPTQIGAPGQLLVPNTNESSFVYDAALVIGSELTSRARVAIEMHLVSDPSGDGAAGPGGLTIALTEAAASYDIIPKHLTFSAGLFWAPFGIINQDWLGARNNFSLIPRASGAVPIHFNEHGIRLNGVFKISDRSAVNYVVSFGNGLNGFPDISGQNSFDFNSNKTVTARVGIFPGLAKDLDVGLSLLNGTLRDVGSGGADPADTQMYASDLNAIGLDATYEKNGIKLRSYFISSSEQLGSAGGFNPNDLNRKGVMIEASYLFKIESKNLYGIVPKLRFDRIDLEDLNFNGVDLNTIDYDATVISFGCNIKATENFIFSLDYNLANENGFPEIDNNRFFGKVTANF